MLGMWELLRYFYKRLDAAYTDMHTPRKTHTFPLAVPFSSLPC